MYRDFRENSINSFTDNGKKHNVKENVLPRKKFQGPKAERDCKEMPL